MEEAVDIETYQEAVGSLTYAAITTRPDIAYATSLVGRFASNPSVLHWQAVKRILHYIQETQSHRLRLGNSAKDTGRRTQENNLILRVYADADFAGDVDGMKSTTGFVVMDPYGAVINWKSSKQRTVAKSTADAEFNATTFAAEEGMWLYKVQGELSLPVQVTQLPLIMLHNDNQACIASLNNGQFRPSTRHVGVRYFWLKEIIEMGEAKIQYLRTDNMVADGLTKSLEKRKHELFLAMLGMY